MTPTPKPKHTPKPGDYVLATKYCDGDPGDHFCVGFLERVERDRYFVVDNNGNQFRANGFRRCQKISLNRGKWLVDRFKEIEHSPRSVWWWMRTPMNNAKATGGQGE